MTQAQLARKAKISSSYISTIERGQRHSITNAALRPAPEVVDAIADALGADRSEARHAAGYASERSGFTDALGTRLAVIEQQLTEFERSEFIKELEVALDIIAARVKGRSDRINGIPVLSQSVKPESVILAKQKKTG